MDGYPGQQIITAEGSLASTEFLHSLEDRLFQLQKTFNGEKKTVPDVPEPSHSST